MSQNLVADRDRRARRRRPAGAAARARDHRIRADAEHRRRPWPRCTGCASSACSISLDDFGTGYSSLSYLRSFPFDKIKIDRCFISGLADGDDSVAIVRAIAGLAKNLGITTTAEGVETKQQMQQVKALGCSEMQGFLFSPPRRVEELAPMFRPRSRRKATDAAIVTRGSSRKAARAR